MFREARRLCCHVLVVVTVLAVGSAYSGQCLSWPSSSASVERGSDAPPAADLELLGELQDDEDPDDDVLDDVLLAERQSTNTPSCAVLMRWQVKPLESLLGGARQLRPPIA